MKRVGLLAVLLFVAPIWSYAQISKEIVAQWTSDIIGRTLTVSYKQSNEDLSASKKFYTYEGWSNIVSFLGDKILAVRRQKLSVTPKPLSEAIIVNQGDDSGVPYWRVNQGWEMQQMNVKIWFSIIVLEQPENSLIIDSVAMHDTPAQLPTQ